VAQAVRIIGVLPAVVRFIGGFFCFLFFPSVGGDLDADVVMYS